MAQFDINTFFGAVLAIFPAWRQAMPSPAFMQATIEAWADVFESEGVPNQEFLNAGIKRAAKSLQSPFMPTPYQFLEFCYPTAAELGYPDANKALQMAFEHSSSKTWHKALPGIWLAWTRVDDKFGLRTDPNAAKQWGPIYRKAIEDVIKSVIRGTQIEMPQLPQLPPEPDEAEAEALTAEQIKENKKRLAATLAELLGVEP